MKINKNKIIVLYPSEELYEKVSEYGFISRLAFCISQHNPLTKVILIDPSDTGLPKYTHLILSPLASSNNLLNSSRCYDVTGMTPEFDAKNGKYYLFNNDHFNNIIYGYVKDNNIIPYMIEIPESEFKRKIFSRQGKMVGYASQALTDFDYGTQGVCFVKIVARTEKKIFKADIRNTKANMHAAEKLEVEYVFEIVSVNENLINDSKFTNFGLKIGDRVLLNTDQIEIFMYEGQIYYRVNVYDIICTINFEEDNKPI